MLEPELIALDVTGSLRLFGGPRVLWRTIVHTCPPGTQAGMACTAWGAALLARQTHGIRRVLRPKTLQRRLNPLPCTALTLTTAIAASLAAWGCHTLGQLRRLPRAGLMQRGLATILQQLDRAYQPGPAPAAWRLPPLSFDATREPRFHGTSLAAIETALIPLLDDLCNDLQAHQAAIAQMILTLHHDTSRCPVPATRLVLPLARPQWEAAACLHLCRLRIQALVLPGPVLRVTLRCPQIQSRIPLATSLLPDTQVDRQHEDRLLDILRARLGPGCLHFPQPRDWPLPEQAESWLETPGHAATPPAQAHWPGSRPFWLLPSPTPLAAQHDTPAWQGAPLHLLAGPERIEGGWWRPGDAPTRNAARDYFIAADAHAARYWIYRDLRSGRWFLHGLFA